MIAPASHADARSAGRILAVAAFLRLPCGDLTALELLVRRLEHEEHRWDLGDAVHQWRGGAFFAADVCLASALLNGLDEQRRVLIRPHVRGVREPVRQGVVERMVTTIARGRP